MKARSLLIAPCCLATSLAFAELPTGLPSLKIGVRAAAQFDSVEATGATDPAGDVLRRQRVTNVASRLRVYGGEKMDALEAVFFFEAGIPVDGTGPSGFGAPGTQNYAGVKGAFGELVLGTKNRPFYAASLATDPWDVLTLGSIDAVVWVAGLKIGAGESGFQVANAAHYTAPPLGNLQLRAAYGAGENRDNSPANARSADEVSLAASYATGPMSAALGALTRAGPTGGRTRSYGLVAAYTILDGPKLGALYEWHRSDVTGTAKRIDDWALTLIWPLGPHELRANYARDSGVKTDPDPDATRSRHWALGYAYRASERTELYLQYAQLKNGRAANNDFDARVGGVAPGGDPRGYALGAIYRF